MSAQSTEGVLQRLREAQERIQTELMKVAGELGPEWALDVEIDWFSTSTIASAARIPTVRLAARVEAYR